MGTINQYFNIGSSTSGRWLTEDSFVFLSTRSGVNQIWEKNISTGEEVQRTFFKERVWNMTVKNGTVFFTMDAGGNEQEQLHMLIPGQEPCALTASPAARHQFGGIKPDGRTIVFTCNGRDPGNFDLCQMDMETGKQEILLVCDDEYWNMPAAMSPDGRYQLYNRMRGQADNGLWILDTEARTTKNVDSAPGCGGQYVRPAWKADSSGFYFLTDKDSEFQYLAYYDVASENITKLYEESWDLEDVSLSSDGKYLAIKINRDGYTALEIYNTETGAFENTPALPKGVMAYYGSNWAEKSHRLLVTLSSGKRPADVWMLDLDNDCVQRMTFTSLEGLDPDELVEPELHRFASVDGLNVPFWVYRGKGSSRSVAIEIHGGPEGQERPMFSPLIQYLVSQGLTIVAPNVRGSTGYGRTYVHLDDVEKRLDSVRDAACLAQHLVAEGFADADKVAVMGGSYGGYMTLACTAFYPDLWVAGVDTVGMSNLETFLENTAEYRRAHRESEYGSLERHRGILREVSPIHKVDQITAALMVVHGSNDPRVPVSEAEQIVASLRSRNVPVEYLLYTDEGHGLSKRKNQLDCYPQVAAFLKKHLKLE